MTSVASIGYADTISPSFPDDAHSIALRQTLDILASHPLAPTNYWVCLGMESREAGAAAKAKSLVEEYRARHAFLDIDFSLHPGNIVGEAAGKSYVAYRRLDHRGPGHRAD